MKIKKLFNKELFLYLVVSLIFFGALINKEFAVDTYATFSFSIKEFIRQFISSGRFLLAFLGAILKFFKISDNNSYFISFAVAIICTGISMYKMYCIIDKDIEDKWVKKILPILIICNIFSIELFLFIEKGIMIFSILMCIYAAENVIKWFENKKISNILIAMIFMLVANFSYQGVVGIFVAVLLIYVLKYSKNIKDFIVNNIIVIFTYGIPAFFDYLSINLFSSGSRVSGSIRISESFQKICINTINMIKNTYGILPKYFLLALLVFIILLIIYEIIINRSKKNLCIELAKILYIIIGTIFVTIAPQIVQNTDSIWFVARSTYSYAALFGILILYLFMNFEIEKNIKIVVNVVVIVLLVMQLYKFNIIEIDRYKVNEMDYEITKSVIEQIKSYEKENNIEIKNISIYHDRSIEYTYSGILATGDTNIKAYYQDWSVKYIIEYYMKKSFNILEPETEIQKEFEKYDWKNFSEKQLIFKGDTLHLCKY